MSEADFQGGLRDPLADNLGYQLRRVSALMMAQLAEALEALDLRVTEASVLLVVDANPGAIQGDVGRLLGIRSANMAPLASALEAKGLILRAPVDGRSHGLRTTGEGRDMAARVRAITATHEAELTDGLDAGAAAAMVEHLRRMRGA